MFTLHKRRALGLQGWGGGRGEEDTKYGSRFQVFEGL